MRSTKVKTLLLGKIFPKREIENLGTLIDRMPADGIEASILWISDLIDWIRQPLQITEELKLPGTKFQIKEVRIRFLVEFLENNPEVQSDLQSLILRLLNETEFLGLFTMSSHQGDHGITYSVFERLARKVLPMYRHDRDLGEIVLFLFPRSDDVEILGAMPSDLKGRLLRCLFKKSFENPHIVLKLTREIMQSMVYLNQLALSLRLKHEIRLRWPFETFEQDPLSQNLKILLDHSQLDPSLLEQFEKGLSESHTQISGIYRKLEFLGTSMTLVLFLERLKMKLARLEDLMRIYRVLLFQKVQINYSADTFLGYDLFLRLVTQGQDRRSLRALLVDNVRLLAKKIVDRTSHTGEHYLVRNLREYKDFFWAAAGGGILTLITVLIKYYSGRFDHSLFSEGFASWINYSGSFILMQVLHLTLATKQPSMTASALASKMEHLETEREIDEFVNEFARISRAQFVAAIGNIGAIIPAAYVFFRTYKELTGLPLMTQSTAESIILHLHPLHSLTLVFAAFTGILLWLSSLAAGWIENFLIYSEIPQALRQNILIQKSIGQSFAHRLANTVEKHAGGLAGNLSLGFLLAFTPIFGKFFGLPLEVKHVTLSAGTLTLAILSHGAVPKETLIWVWIGIGLIGALNFAVSFYCSFFLASRARGISKELRRRIFKRTLTRFLKNPFYFLFPSGN